MLELRILVDNIDYDSIAEYLIPAVAEKLRRQFSRLLFRRQAIPLRGESER